MTKRLPPVVRYEYGKPLHIEREPDRGTELAGAAMAGAAFPFALFGWIFLDIDPSFGVMAIYAGAIVAACSIGFFAISRHHEKD